MARGRVSVGLCFCVVLILALMPGCTVSKYMREVQTGTVYAPGSDRALVIFLRPSVEENTYGASVFEATSTEDQLVGILNARNKVAYLTSPGEHIFMSIGQGAEFLKARLDPGKTYYVEITPVRADWKDQFLLRPVKRAEASGPAFKRSR